MDEFNTDFILLRAISSVEKLQIEKKLFTFVTLSVRSSEETICCRWFS